MNPRQIEISAALWNKGYGTYAIAKFLREKWEFKVREHHVANNIEKIRQLASFQKRTA